MTTHDMPTTPPVEFVSADGDHHEQWSADLDDAEFARLVKETKVITPVTRILLAVLLAATGFIGGVLVERSQQPEASSTATAANAVRNGGNANQGAGANGGGGGAGGGATVGTITLVDGPNLYVTTAEGDVVKVVTNAQTTISVSKNGSVSDLDPSKTVVVQGTTNPDGSVTASQVTQGGFGAFGGGRRNGGTGNGAGGGSTRSGGGGG